MARIWSSGFELNSTTAGVEWTTTSGSPSVQGTTVRNGSYAGQIPSLSSGIPKYFDYQFQASGTNGPFFVRFYLRIATKPGSNTQIAHLRSSSGAQLIIKLTTTGTLQLLNSGTTQIGSDSAALSTGVWYRIEIKIDNTGGATHDILEAMLNGNVFATSSVQTANGVQNLRLGGNLGSETQAVGNWYFDDVAINDATGTQQNGYPGDGNIIHLLPNGAGESTGWTKAGSVPAATNYQSVNEVTPDDGTTIVTSKTLNQLDMYLLGDTPAALSSAYKISVVQVGLRWSGSASNNSTGKLQLESQASGNKAQSSALTQTGTAYATNGPAVPDNYPLTSYTDPQAGGAWTKTLLDSAQAGNQITAAANNTLNMSTIWVLVDYSGMVYDNSVKANIVQKNIDVPGVYAFGLQTDGTQNYVDLGTLGNLGSNLASGAYVKFDINTTQTTAGGLGGWSASHTSFGITFNQNYNQVNSNHDLYVSVEGLSNLYLSGGTNANTSINFNDGNWHTIEVAWNFSTKVITIKIDGVAQTVTYQTQAAIVSWANFVDHIMIGAFASGATPGSYFAATWDNFVIGTSAANLYGAYSFDENAGITLYDTSRQGNNGTLSKGVGSYPAFVNGNSLTSQLIKANIGAVSATTYTNDNSVKANILNTYADANSVKTDILVVNTTDNNSVKADVLVTNNTLNNSVKADIVGVSLTASNSIKADILTTYSQNTSSKIDVLSTNKANIVNESMVSAPSTGTLGGNFPATWNAAGYLELTPNLVTEDGHIDYSGVLPLNFQVDFDFLNTPNNTGADATWFYFGCSSIPTSEDDVSGIGYVIAYDEYSGEGKPYLIAFGGSILANTTGGAIFSDGNWHHAKITVFNNTITMYLDGVQVLTTSTAVGAFPGTHYGWAARTGGITNEHRVKNLLLTQYGTDIAIKASIVVTNSNDQSVKADVLHQNSTQSTSVKADILVVNNTDANSVKANINIGGVTYTNNNSIKADIIVTNTNLNSIKADLIQTYNNGQLRLDGQRYPTSSVDAGGGSFSIGNLVGLQQEDVSAASGALNSFGVTNFNYIDNTAFGFSIPSDATILGIVVEISRAASQNTATRFLTDSTVKLIKGGTAQGTNHADTMTQWGTMHYVAVSYGSSSDLWGIALTPSDVNASNFGVRFTPQGEDQSGSTTSADIDYVRMTIYYTAPENSACAKADIFVNNNTTNNSVKANILTRGVTNSNSVIASILQKAATLIDNFNNGYDSTKWYQIPSTGTINFVNGDLEYGSSASSGYNEVESIYPYDLTGSSVFVQVPAAGNQSIATLDVILYAFDSRHPSGNYKVYVDITNNALFAYQVVNGVQTNLASLAYNAAAMQFVRLRESAGTLYWEYSADAVNWTTLYSAANPIALDSVKLATQEGTWQTESLTTTVRFDNFNYLANTDNNSVKAYILTTLSIQNTSVKADIFVANNTQVNSVKANITGQSVTIINSVKADILATTTQPNSVRQNIKTTYYTGMTYDWTPSTNTNPEGQNRGFNS